MTLVRPDRLEKYGKRLDHHADRLNEARSYCARYCDRTDGMTGILLQGQPMVHMAHQASTELLGQADNGLTRIGQDLRRSAEDYRRSDAKAADTVWRSYGERSGLPGDYAESGPINNTGSGSAGDFRDVETFALHPPVTEIYTGGKTFADKIAEAKQMLGKVETMCSKYLHFSLADVAGKISGNWDLLYEHADAYGNLAEGVGTVRANVGHGMQGLVDSWDGEAARAFEYLIDERWVPALETLEKCLKSFSDMFKFVASGAETLFDALVLLVVEAVRWLPGKLAQIFKLAKGMMLAGLKTALKQLVTFLLDLRKSLQSILTLLGDLVREGRAYAQSVASLASAIKASFGGGLDPIKRGA